MSLDDEVLVTLWGLPNRIDDTETDFLGNPLQIQGELVRCFEGVDAAGVFEILYCERAR